MAWFNLFSGPTVEKLEQKGDALGTAGFWGEAKLEYERARRKLEAVTDQDRDSLGRLEGKIAGTKDELAREHHQNALQLAVSGDFKEALDLVELALELTGDASLKETLAQQHQTIEAARAGEHQPTLSDPEYDWDPDEENVGFQAPDEQFSALCGTLPDPVRRAYLGYGADFKTGYLALNNGDFETAARYLARALETQNAADSYIPLELATAYLHLNRPEQARQLLETLLDHHPDALPAYQILCEIYWEQGAFDRAEALLASIPGELAASLAVFVLEGETLFQAGRFDDAKIFYRDFIATYGWDESIARALARTHEALNEMDHARRMYQEIMGHCSGCHSRIDPLVKEKVADLSFAAGIHDTAILELYLSLAQELPQKAFAYYAKVSRIYQTLGNETEARRFLALADRMAPR
ncbi:MAG: tetratricopeptide repeat protein [Desulfosarcina sp.]|nr:tetratricopeptide repeat protein [Desulfosarcina sp.]MBC2743284.1 tetratricopeptide repeat protein [Desulfosarcina sp.]MBC2766194.1 tetratricopeptide repeat protein [Desulfosarcina sp.]